MWNVKIKVVPVVRGATATISNSFRIYLSNTLWQNKFKEAQQPTILGTVHMLRHRAFIAAYHITCTMYSYLATDSRSITP
jgi:hypothetical protein